MGNCSLARHRIYGNLYLATPMTASTPNFALFLSNKPVPSQVKWCNLSPLSHSSSPVFAEGLYSATFITHHALCRPESHRHISVSALVVMLATY